MEELVGRTIRGLGVTVAGDALQVDTDSGPLTFVVDGDCCSETWWYNIDGVDALIGGKVLSVESVLVRDVEPSRQDSDQVYSYKLRTDKGYANFEFRNSSNGYYGGSISCVLKEPARGDVEPITSDWCLL